MLNISRSEKYFILTFLIFGLCCTGLSYYKKTVSNTQVKTINIDETHTLININTANAMQLERLPGIGPVLAERIINYRQEVSGFRNPEELKNVKGIGDKKFEKIKDLISINE